MTTVVRYTTIAPSRDPEDMPRIINMMSERYLGETLMSPTPADAKARDADPAKLIRDPEATVVYKVTFEKMESTE